MKFVAEQEEWMTRVQVAVEGEESDHRRVREGMVWDMALAAADMVEGIPSLDIHLEGADILRSEHHCTAWAAQVPGHQGVSFLEAEEPRLENKDMLGLLMLTEDILVEASGLEDVAGRAAVALQMKVACCPHSCVSLR